MTILFTSYVPTKIRALLLSLSVTVPTSMSYAADSKDELEALLNVLAEQTEIATKTSLNKDYVPGLVSVLQADDLRARGVRVVWEALQLVPGMEVLADEIGARHVIVRGTGRVFSSGNVKVMMDGISMNASSITDAQPVLHMPISQIERIEIIRGPGSAVHGEFALMGVVNVVTRTTGNGAGIQWQSNDGYGINGYHGWQSDDKRWEYSANAAAWMADGYETVAGEDKLFVLGGALSAVSNAPGPINDEERFRSLILQARSDSLSFHAHLLEQQSGDYFGINHYLPPDNDNLAIDRQTFGARASKVFSFSNSGDIKVEAQYQRAKNNKTQQYTGPAWEFNASAPVPAFPIVSDVRLSEESYGLNASFHSTSDNHHWLLEGGVKYVEVLDSALALNLDLNTFLATTTMNAFSPVIPKGESRWQYFLTLQDEWRVNDLLSLTLGLRADHYDDAGSAVTPRAAAVLRLTAKDTVKVQYARAFRPPSFLEKNGALDEIKAMTVDAIELAYIRREGAHRIGVTAFHHQSDEWIIFTERDAVDGFDNVGTLTTTGIELEAEYNPSRLWELDGHISYTHTHDDSTQADVAGSSRWLAGLGARWQAKSNLNIHLQSRIVGEKIRSVTDSRSPLSAYAVFDVTASWRLLPTTTVRIGLHNISDVQARQPAIEGSYLDDFPQSGRSASLMLEYRPKK